MRLIGTCNGGSCGWLHFLLVISPSPFLFPLIGASSPGEDGLYLILPNPGLFLRLLSLLEAPACGNPQAFPFIEFPFPFLFPGKGFCLACREIQRLQVHVILDLVPADDKAGSMGTEDRTGRVVQIPLRVIRCLCNDFLRVPAWLIALQGTGQPPDALGIGHDLLLVIPHGGHGGSPHKYGHPILHLRRLKRPMHALNVRHCPPNHRVRHLQAELVDRL